MDIGHVTVHFFLDICEFKFDKLYEDNEMLPHDIIFEKFTFESFNLAEVDAYGDYQVTYEFPNMPKPKELAKLKVLIAAAERRIIDSNGYKLTNLN